MSVPDSQNIDYFLLFFNGFCYDILGKFGEMIGFLKEWNVNSYKD
jgi:hypothetical protein